MANEMIRKILNDFRLKQWELAEMLEISEFTLSRKLRRDLPQEEQERIVNLIKKWREEQCQ